ncbi:MAG: hypothetical protein IJU76_11355 [Desulfovibrionaceae bacterium]|nr:hypothetical protein [Desulfovibrionaceae bacterium]
MQNGKKGVGRANRKKTVLPVPEQQVVSIYEFMMIPFCVRHGVVALQHSCAKRMVSALSASFLVTPFAQSRKVCLASVWENSHLEYVTSFMHMSDLLCGRQRRKRWPVWPNVHVQCVQYTALRRPARAYDFATLHLVTIDK